ncbi:hypothetical protein QA634_02450 [Methylobacterium sp. CB376]|nr:tectonin domain-containing protein [Methylobacterium nodulans]WFT80785.1 hypothetical protein QA634_02450 [Methylobacterium nodulans]
MLNAVDGSLSKYAPDKTWVKLAGNFKDVAVVDANSIYGIQMDGVIVRFNGQTWRRVGYGGKTISASADGTIVIVNILNEIWKKYGDNDQEAWGQIPGKAQRVAAMNANSFWSVGLDGDVYRADQTGKWVLVGSNAVDIAASPDGSVAVINSDVGVLWRKFGDDTVEAWGWVKTPGPAQAVAVPNGQHAFVIGRDGVIYRQ